MKGMIIVLLLGMLIFGCVQEPVPEPPKDEEPTEPQFCDAMNPCDKGDCYKFEDEETPICFEGDPCSKCASGMCNIAESYPMQVFCIDEEEPVCEDLCGDGVCQEIVCMAIGCPCAETPESCPEDCIMETEPEPEPEPEPEVETENEMGLQYCDEAECPQGHACKLLQTEERPTCIPSIDIFSDCDMCSSGKCYIYSYAPLALKCLAEEQ